jgi:hypothetical protein
VADSSILVGCLTGAKFNIRQVGRWNPATHLIWKYRSETVVRGGYIDAFF